MGGGGWAEKAPRAGSGKKRRTRQLKKSHTSAGWLHGLCFNLAFRPCPTLPPALPNLTPFIVLRAHHKNGQSARERGAFEVLLWGC